MRLFGERDLNNITVIFLLLVVILCIYINSLNSPFLWDDQYLIVNNPYIGQPVKLLTSPLFPKITGAIEISYYRPLQALSYSFDYLIWKLNPVGYHITNIILHLINAVLFYILLTELLGNKMLNLYAALFFSLHPIFISSVTYISGRADLLMLCFLLMTLLMLVKLKEHKQSIYYFLSLTFFLAALLSKEASLLGLIFFFFYFIIYHNKKNRLILYSGYLFIALFYSFFRISIIKETAFLFQRFHISGWHFLNVVKMFFNYVLIFLFPLNSYLGRTVSYSHTFFSSFVITSFLFLFLIVFLIYWTKRKDNKILLFGLLWFCSFIPLLSLYHCIYGRAGNEIILPGNDLYIASVGLIVIFVWLLDILTRQRSQAFKMILMVAYFLALGARTIALNNVWADPVRFYQYSLGFVKDSNFAYIIYSNLGLEYKKRGDFQKAIQYYNVGLSIKQDASLYHNLANIYLETGDILEARKNYAKAIQLDSQFAYPYVGLGMTFLKENRIDQAKAFFDKAISLHPENNRIKEIINDQLRNIPK